jgi:N-acetylglutamate synthase-like GNAT family acetyltransferase
MGQRTGVSTLTTMMEQRDSTILVMRHERDIVACVALRRLDERAWYLSMLAIDPDRQEGGLGKAIMAGAEKFAHEHGAQRIEISVIRQRESLIA